MKRIAILIAIALTVTLVSVAVTADDMASKETTLNGTYHWTNADEKGALKAVFTATGDDSYDVSFYFQFRDKDHTYTGTATGSLNDGSLSGVVKNENKRRTFTFEGTTSAGTFEGRHAETTGGGERRTGTLVLDS